MNPLVIMGFGQHENHQDVKADPWQIVYQMVTHGIPMTPDDVVECVQNGDQDGLKPSDLVGRKIIEVYSWGLDSLRQVSNDFNDLDDDVTLIIVLGVQYPLGIGKTTINLGNFKGRAFCFFLGPNLAFPVDVPIKDAPFVTFTEDLRISPLVDRLNVSLAPLAKSVPWWNPFSWGNKVWNHSHVENDVRLLRVLLQFVGVTV